MKLNASFVKHTMDDKTLVIPLGGASFHGVVKGNKSVGFILDCLEHDTTEEEIVGVMCKRFDGDPVQIREDVHNVLTQLKGIGAIDE